MARNKEIDWGVVEHFELIADTFSSLKAAMTIFLSYHMSISAFAEHEGTLRLYWHESAKGSNKLMSQVSDPAVAATIVWDWLKNAKYPAPDPYSDGEKKGYRIMDRDYDDKSYVTDNSYLFCVIRPYMVEYSK